MAGSSKMFLIGLVTIGFFFYSALYFAGIQVNLDSVYYDSGLSDCVYNTVYYIKGLF